MDVFSTITTGNSTGTAACSRVPHPTREPLARRVVSNRFMGMPVRDRVSSFQTNSHR
jgi:hypothetical protein